jgi:hypothetical protein
VRLLQNHKLYAVVTIATELEISDLRLEICQLKLEWISATELETIRKFYCRCSLSSFVSSCRFQVLSFVAVIIRAIVQIRTLLTNVETPMVFGQN